MSLSAVTFQPQNNGKCLTCQLSAHRAEHGSIPPKWLSRWAMFGCTCTAEATTEQSTYLDSVTR
jgi:hypothetical protein